jgi:transposase
MIDAERWAEARRLHRVEGLTLTAIARRLGLHRRTVRRILLQETFVASRKPARRGSIVDAYREHVERYLADHPDLSAVQVHRRLVSEHSYPGEVSVVRRLVGELRRRQGRAFQHLSFLPGECAQVDWANLGHTTVAGARRRVSAFVMVLAYSRLMYVELTLSERMDAFLEAHVRACAALGGRVPRRLLYDNCRTVVVQRVGGAVRFHPRLIELADHYRFQPTACPPRKPWHKGRVESGIGYLRTSFQRGRGAIVDLERERRDLALWVEEVANVRLHRVTRRRPRELFDEAEAAALLPILGQPFDAAHLEVSASADKYYRVPFDGNRYSVPYQLAHARGLVLRATTTHVEVYRGIERVARHERCYGRGQDVIDPAHDRGLRDRSRRAHSDSLLARFIAVLGPEAEDYARELCREHVQAARHLRRVLTLVDRFGTAQVRAALAHARRFRAYGADYGTVRKFPLQFT